VRAAFTYEVVCLADRPCFARAGTFLRRAAIWDAARHTAASGHQTEVVEVRRRAVRRIRPAGR
jgi:hypothetical protein